MTKQHDLSRIEAMLRSRSTYADDEAVVGAGDSLDLLRCMPDQSVSLILTDPPYHTTKKTNIYGDTHFAEDERFLEWMADFFREWRRVLRPNGCLYCFCSSEMSARLDVLMSQQFNVLSRIVWTKPNDPGFDGWKGKMKKEALRQWYPHSERILFAEPAVEGNLHRSPFGQFLRETRRRCGLSSNELAESIGAYGKVNHGGAVSNWETGRNIPSPEQYRKVCDALIATGKVVSMPAYEEAIRVFRVDASKEFTDVWTFPSVRPYKGKHPAEKPTALLEHAIEVSTFTGDVVLDCFAGSGSTALAALKLGRRAVALEIDPRWVQAITDRVRTARGVQARTMQFNNSHPLRAARMVGAVPQLPLFKAAGK